MISKGKLRKIVLECRQMLAEDEYRRRNQMLCDQVVRFVQTHNIRIIHCFLSIHTNREPDFSSLFPIFWKEGRKVMVSKTDVKAKIMSHYWLEEDTSILPNSWGIPEPKEAIQTEITQSELILVPLLLGDRSGHRLGYGGGFYDRLLVDYKGVSAGVSIGPLVDKLPTDEWDIPVNEMLYYH